MIWLGVVGFGRPRPRLGVRRQFIVERGRLKTRTCRVDREPPGVRTRVLVAGLVYLLFQTVVVVGGYFMIRAVYGSERAFVWFMSSAVAALILRFALQRYLDRLLILVEQGSESSELKVD